MHCSMRIDSFVFGFLDLNSYVRCIGPSVLCPLCLHSDQGFDAFWADINREVQCADLKLQRVLYPEDNKPYIGIINTVQQHL